MRLSWLHVDVRFGIVLRPLRSVVERLARRVVERLVKEQRAPVRVVAAATDDVADLVQFEFGNLKTNGWF